jgi:hypothetical protein
METERLKIAVRVLNAFCACVFPHIKDVIALREMAESPKEQRMRLSEPVRKWNDFELGIVKE